MEILYIHVGNVFSLLVGLSVTISHIFGHGTETAQQFKDPKIPSQIAAPNDPILRSFPSLFHVVPHTQVHYYVNDPSLEFVLIKHLNPDDKMAPSRRSRGSSECMVPHLLQPCKRGEW